MRMKEATICAWIDFSSHISGLRSIFSYFKTNDELTIFIHVKPGNNIVSFALKQGSKIKHTDKSFSVEEKQVFDFCNLDNLNE